MSRFFFFFFTNPSSLPCLFLPLSLPCLPRHTHASQPGLKCGRRKVGHNQLTHTAETRTARDGETCSFFFFFFFGCRRRARENFWGIPCCFSRGERKTSPPRKAYCRGSPALPCPDLLPLLSALPCNLFWHLASFTFPPGVGTWKVK